MTRRGVTIVELLVALGILGLLTALLLPAVQQAREASRRMTCQNNLWQFGIAFTSFSDAHGAYPTAQLPESAYWRMLPYFGRRDLAEFLRALQESQTPGGESPDSYYVEFFGCPDDPVVHRFMVFGGTSYYYNAGTEFRLYPPFNGFLKSTREDTAPEEISDGFSQTVAMSERLVEAPPGTAGGGSRPDPVEPRRHFWWTEVRYSDRGEEPLAVEQCRNHRTTTFPQYSGVKAPNLFSGSGYDHMLPPNHPGCYNGPEDFGIESDLELRPASSNHPGGVNSLLADGSVHMISNSIDTEVWGALGTRNGGESATLPF